MPQKKVPLIPARNRHRRLAVSALAALAAVVAVGATQAFAVDQTPKNGCTSPVAYAGALTSPAFSAPNGGVISFQAWYETESVNSPAHDAISVQYRDSAGNWQTITQLNAGASGGGSPDRPWSSNGLGAAPGFQAFTGLPRFPPGATQVRFLFDTVDASFQGFRGAGVDDVTVSNVAPALSQTFDAGLGGWTADAPSGPGGPRWQVLSNPGAVTVRSPEISPDLVTIAGTALPTNGTPYAWFGNTASGTYCGPDFANRASLPLVRPPPQRLRDLPPPRLGKRANIEPASGKVFVAIRPRRGASGRARASQKGLRFVPLREARQIPIGSFISTRKGSVRIQTARGRGRKRQLGTFSRGLFQVLQSRKRRAKGLTTLRLKGSTFRRCRTRRVRRAEANASRRRLSRRRIRRLRARARGRFRTRGRYSAATVRGTIWTTVDRCDGTLTKVKRGRVAVRDFRRKRTIIVKRGKSYLAKAPARR